VEDEDSLRALVRTCLTRLGYRVLECSHGQEALELWRDHRDAIQLLLTDLVMPKGVTGTDLARQLQADRPDLKVVYTSGYRKETTIELVAGVNYLPKPFEPAGLAGIVRNALDSA
jgi:CheY-like chemotaxis protein